MGPGVQQNKGLLPVDEARLTSLIKKEPISNQYIVEHTPFARGKFAAVRKMTHRETGVEYAGKFIRKRRRSMDQREEILHEVAVLLLSEPHQRIVNLHEVYETPTEMALVLELASGGELQRVVDLQDGLEESEAIKVMKQVLEAITFLHDHNIAHLDLKPQNMLLTSSYPDTDVKLCDFGISRVIREGIEVREILGTPDYVAPEVLSYEPISLATDMWSIGVLAYVLLSGYSPFAGDTKQQTFCNISQCALSFPNELFKGVSPVAKHFIRSTLVVEPRSRLSAAECLSHPWLTGELSPNLPLIFESQAEEDDDEEELLNDMERSVRSSSSSGGEGSPSPSSSASPESPLPPPDSPEPYNLPPPPSCATPCHDSLPNSPVVEIIRDRAIIC